AEAGEELVVELDHLGVDRRVGRADRLDRELPVLAVAAPLRCRVAVHGRDREELDRLTFAVETVLEVRARNRSRGLGPERERAAALVLERVHLFLDDVRASAGSALEEGGVLEGGRLDPAIAVELAEALGFSGHQAPEPLFGGEDVVGAARRLERRHEARSGARNGLRASSTPSVVGG